MDEKSLVQKIFEKFNKQEKWTLQEMSDDLKQPYVTLLTFHFNIQTIEHTNEQTNKQTKKKKKMQIKNKALKKKPSSTKPKLSLGRKKKDEVNVDAIDFTKKILHASWHPQENTIAVAATNNLFIFTQN